MAMTRLRIAISVALSFLAALMFVVGEWLAKATLWLFKRAIRGFNRLLGEHPDNLAPVDRKHSDRRDER